MERYKNLGGNSGVAAYEIGQGSITVQFKDGSAYLYTSQSAGMANLAEMQRLAVEATDSTASSIVLFARDMRKNFARHNSRYDGPMGLI